VTAPRSRVLEWQMVTVAFLCSNSMAAGLLRCRCGLRLRRAGRRWDVAALEDLDHSGGRCRSERWAAAATGQRSRVEAIHIFLGSTESRSSFGSHGRAAAVESGCHRCLRGRFNSATRDSISSVVTVSGGVSIFAEAQFGAGFHLLEHKSPMPDVANQHCCEAGANALRGQRLPLRRLRP